MAVFQRFAQHFEDAAVEFGQFVKKEDAVVGKADFARFGDGAAADERGGGAAVVRRAIGALPPVGGVEAAAGKRADGGAFDGLVVVHRGQDAGEALRQHGFAGAGRAAHQHVMTAGGSDEQGAFRLVLADDVGVVGVLARWAQGGGGRRGPVALAVQDGGDFGEAARAVGVVRGDQCRFVVVFRCGDDVAAGVCSGERAGQDAAHRAQLAAQGEFAVVFVRGGGVWRDLSGGGEDAECDGEVVARTVFGQFCRGEVDGDVFCRKFEAAVQDGGANAVFAFFDGFFWQADEGHRWQAAGKVDFDPHQRRVHAQGGAGVGGGEVHAGSVGWKRGAIVRELRR